MENSQFIYKYKPKDLSDINYFSMTKLLPTIENIDCFRFLINGNVGSGKTTVLNVIKNYLVNYKIYDVETFFDNKKYFYNKKNIILMIDNLDYYSSKLQQKIKKSIDNLNINLIATATNLNNVQDNILVRTLIFKLNFPDNLYIFDRLLLIKTKENIDISNDYLKQIANGTYGSIGEQINYLEKISYINSSLTQKIMIELSTNIDNNIWIEYDIQCKNKNLIEIRNLLNKIKIKGYSCIDALHSYLSFVKSTNIYDEDTKYKIIKLILIYIGYFYDCEETSLLMLFFSNKLIILLNSIYVPYI